MFYSSKDELSLDDIENFVEKHRASKADYELLQDYYEGRHRIITDKSFQSEDNHYIIHPYCTYITDMLTGYFMGQPVKYTAVDHKTDKDDELLSILSDIFRLNDESYHNMTLAKVQSIKGHAVEILWRDEDANVRFSSVEPDEAFGIYDSTLEKKLKFAIRYYDSVDELGRNYTAIEVYDDTVAIYYEKRQGLVEVKRVPHYFKDVPFVFYLNNEEDMGDFEKVIPLVDAYDIAQTSTLIDMQDFTDSYLELVNMSGTSEEDLKEARKHKTLLLEADGRASWLVKPVNDSWVENYKNRLSNDIHKFSNTPDLTDENFGNNLSGVSLSYKLLAMEQIRSTKERNFKKGLTRRIELICNYLSYSNKSYDFTGIGMEFNNTLPQNVSELANTISVLSPYVSKETLLSQLPFIENAKEEMEKKAAEEDYTDDYKDLEGLIRTFGQVGDLEDEEE